MRAAVRKGGCMTSRWLQSSQTHTSSFCSSRSRTSRKPPRHSGHSFLFIDTSFKTNSRRHPTTDHRAIGPSPFFAGAQCDIIIVIVAAIVDEMTRYIHSFRSVYGIFVLNLRKIGRNRLPTFTKVDSRFLAEPNGVKTDFKNCTPNPRVLEGVTLTALPWRSGLR